MLIQAVKRLPQIQIFEHHTAISLLTADQKPAPAQAQIVTGAYVLAEQTSEIHTFLANVVVLATGGAGKIYRYTSNPEVATGDGIAMAYRAVRAVIWNFINFIRLYCITVNVIIF